MTIFFAMRSCILNHLFFAVLKGILRLYKNKSQKEAFSAVEP
jgi:hypothetical protein